MSIKEGGKTSKIKDEYIEMMRAARAKGRSIRDIAKDLGVSHTTVNRYTRRVRYRKTTSGPDGIWRQIQEYVEENGPLTVAEIMEAFDVSKRTAHRATEKLPKVRRVVHRSVREWQLLGELCQGKSIEETAVKYGVREFDLLKIEAKAKHFGIL